MKRRLLSVLLAMMLASSCMLASCGGDSPEVPESKESSTETTPPAEQDKETASAETTPVVFTLQDAEGTPGSTVEVEVSIRAVSEINSVALHTLTYDKDILTFQGFADGKSFEEKYCIFPNGFDEEKEDDYLSLLKAVGERYGYPGDFIDELLNDGFTTDDIEEMIYCQ